MDNLGQPANEFYPSVIMYLNAGSEMKMVGVSTSKSRSTTVDIIYLQPSTFWFPFSKVHGFPYSRDFASFSRVSFYVYFSSYRFLIKEKAEAGDGRKT